MNRINYRLLHKITSVAGIVALSLAARMAIASGDYLYVGDYYNQSLDRYAYSLDANGNLTLTAAGTTAGSAVFITGGIKEGLQGTNDDLIVVTGGGATLTRYDFNGNVIGQIAVKNANGTAHTFAGIGNVAITSDGKYLYAPEETNSVIDKVDLATGTIVATASLAGAHDVAIGADGTVYGAGYANNTGVVTFDANLDSSSKNQLIAAGLDGLTRPSGMSIDSSGSLYVMQNENGNGASVADGVYHFNISGSGTSATASLLSDPTNTALKFSFGTAIGPDGNLYIATLGDFNGRNSTYSNGVYEYNINTQAVTEAVVGGTNFTGTAGSLTGSTPGPSGLYGPKYLKFSTNFVNANDAGLVPEPSTFAILSVGLMAGIGLFRRRKHT